jgi:hypothetical protein
MGVTAGTPRGTAAARRARSARLLGPGISVRISMTPAMLVSGRQERKVEQKDTCWREQPDGRMLPMLHRPVDCGIESESE